MTFIAAPTSNWNSFAAVADADAYHADRANADWDDLVTSDKQIYLIRATDYIAANYSFGTDPVSTTIDSSVIAATAMLALYAITHDLFAVEDTRITTSESNTLSGVGTIAATYSMAKADRFPFVTGMLSTVATFTPATGSTVGTGWMLK